MAGFGIAASAVLIVTASAAFIPEGTTPSGTFACSLVSGEGFDGKTDGMISLDEITLDGTGTYSHGTGSGMVAWKNNAMHFTSGDMSGTIAVVRHALNGARYLHIDSTEMNEPAGEPKFGDHVCVEK